DADDDRIFCVNLTICDQNTQQQDKQVLSTPHWLSPLTISYTRDHSNALFSPTRGSIFRLDGEYAARASGSDFAYWRAVAELSEYREILPGLVLAARVRPGFARSLAETGSAAGLGLHPSKRFFGGGPNSVRGFAQGQLGPKVLTVDAATVLARPKEQGGAGCSLIQVNDGTCRVSSLDAGVFDAHPTGGAALLEGNFEARFPLGPANLRGAAFVDYGQLWNTPSDVRLRQLVWTPGLGVRYFSAIGPIRIDVGYNPQGSEPAQVLSTQVGVRQIDGTCVEASAQDGQQLCDRGSLTPIQEISWPNRKTFLNHLQLHFSIGQAF
ncbi:MAG TPA: BamA/TamA family outer membrane protein, partial [Longimicrobiales bacterium]